MFWATTAIPRERRENVCDPRELEALVGPEESPAIIADSMKGVFVGTDISKVLMTRVL